MKLKNFIALTLSIVMTMSLMVSTASAAELTSSNFFDEFDASFSDSTNPTDIISAQSLTATSSSLVSAKVGFNYDTVSFVPSGSNTTSVTSLEVERIFSNSVTSSALTSTNTSTAALWVGKTRIGINTTNLSNSSIANTKVDWDITRSLGRQSDGFIQFNDASVSAPTTTANSITGTVAIDANKATFNVKVTPFEGDYTSTVNITGASPTETTNSVLYDDLVKASGVDFTFGESNNAATATATIKITQTDNYDSTNSFTYTFTVTRADYPTEPTVPTIVNVYFYDGETLLDTKSVTSGSSLDADMPANPTKSNYTFNNWYTIASGTSAEVTFTKDTIVTGDTAVYANWTASTVPTIVNVSFYDGDTLLDTKSVTIGSALGADMPANPTKSNYTFNNWYTRASGTSAEVTFTKDTLVTGDTAVYADWTYRSTSSGSGSSGGGSSNSTTPINSNSTTPGTSNSTNTTTAGDNSVKNLLSANRDVKIDLGTAGSISLGEKTFADLLKASKPLTVSKDGASITVSTDVMKSLGLDSSGDVVIALSSAKNVTVTGADKVDAKNKDLLGLSVSISIKVDGKEVKEFSTPLAVSINVSEMKLTKAQTDKLTGVRILPNGRVNQLGGSIDNNGNYNMKTSKLSQYGVIISDSLVKVLTTVGAKSFTVNGKSQSADVAPMITDGRTMVPVRFIAEAFGADVSWNKGTKTVTIALNDKTLTLKIGTLSAGMDVAPFIEDGRTMVPLRYISEQLDANVIWNASSKTVEIYR